ncbi:methylated-DNA--[protein]-cysteine S-methyltransferase [Alicyclobacillus cycloheptanicus]|uniref:Methylated-DNA--protein-cysteine methyltransferase n=1 Tax=Alicyclobacillus cycloheptanicus TaxID=1457 RepID=A0ABT9XLZ8_9BACL|nr:methylated-DNA--[protein]-cysteine S-methyltransferase [Alicyclobacillus cycloheptanicus]MDQ0191336.1 methylated-DNA-[protein]-cysteine S-methyltransferase [Alicyclobacillus cycloheptanicus]WDM00803.1 methylated-DNA--[protein]-cysteine S-methyltransferase [Alicyclobacillus cycloheptanicus]
MRSLSAVYWDTLRHGAWTLHLAATDKGLCSMTLPNEPFNQLQAWVNRHAPGSRLVHEPKKLHPYREQIEAYLSRNRTVFTVPLDLRGTPFQIQVWRALLDIPFGVTRSYAEVAAAIGQPTAVRAVGAANGANPVPIVVPCHRVIGKNKTLTGYRGGIAMKAQLLTLEGVRI